MATRTATQETTSGTKRADAYLEPTIADIWPKGTKGNHFMKWFVFKLVANCTAITCCCLYYVAPLMVMSLPVLLWLRPRMGLTFLALCLGSLTWPSSNWPAFRRVFQHLFDFFNVRSNFYDVSPRLDRKKRHIWAMHPHAIVPLHALTWCAFLDKQDRELYGVGGMANAIYFMPFVRNIFMWLNNISASYKVLRSSLLANKNVFLLPDGIAGVFYARRGQHYAVLKKRRGMFRLAIETGASIVPIYCFGANDLLDQAVADDSLIGKLSRKFRVSVTIFWGQFGLPIPFPVNMSYVFGDPVPPPELSGSNAKMEDAVEHFYREYVKSLKEAFDKYKDAAGYAKAELKIV